MPDNDSKIAALQAENDRLRESLDQERATSRLAEARLARYVRDLERSNADLEQFAYAASHDLQEPLRMVSQFSSLLEKHLYQSHRSALDADTTLYLGHMANGAERARRLILGLLEYSRVGRQATWETVPLARAVEEAIEMLNGAVAEAGAKITCDENMPSVWGDLGMLSRVFLNLIMNAIRFARSGVPARVHVSATVDGDEVVVAVVDNGIGIDPRHAERIFGIFQRLHLDMPGTGLGLAIVKKVVEKHGGRIWVESAPGQGAVFKFSLLRTEPGAGA